MANKKLAEIFGKYTPKDRDEERLLSDGICVSTKIDQDKTNFVATAKFSRLYGKQELYKTEENIRSFYEMRSVRISPQYPPELLTSAYFSEIFIEASTRKALTRGLIINYEADIGEQIDIYIHQTSSAMALIECSDAASVIEKITEEEFGIKKKVVLHMVDDGRTGYERFENEIAEIERASVEKAMQQIKSYERYREESSAPDREAMQKAINKKLSSLCEEEPLDDTSDPANMKIGRYSFDTTSASLLYGDEFVIEPVPIRSIAGQMSHVCIIGSVFGCDSREIRGKDKFSVSFYVTDGDSTMKIKAVLPTEKASALMGIKEGTSIAVKGRIKIDTFDQDYVMSPDGIMTVKKLIKKDKAEEKRVELHLHTQMSSLDATIPPDEAVKIAAAWGHKAVAITDHGNVQGFPEAMIAAEKLKKDKDIDIKVIYGMEGYFTDDTQRAAYGSSEGSFEDEFIVFDTETTGLSALSCRLIEIGAVRVKGGKVIDVFNTYVDPEGHVPANITELTGISDDMLVGAPSEEEAVRAFLEFAGSDILIAHNASFDINFISAAAKRHGIKFEPVYIDTVALSRYVNPELKKHKLDIIADYYGLGDFNHHRASDDAEMLALIFFRMIERLREEGIETISEMNKAMAGGTDFLKQKTHHIIILVKNKIGLKNLYKLVSFSNLKYFYKKPQIPKSVLNEYRDGLIIGSACCAGELYQAILDGKPDEEINEIVQYYDYLEIQPLTNNGFLIKEGTVTGVNQLIEINKRIIELGRKNNKPVCATTDAHVIDKFDEIGKRIIYHGKKLKDSDNDIGVYMRTTQEMLDEFYYLDEETRYEVVVKNTNAVADMIENVRPIPKGSYPPSIDGADDELRDICYKNMHRLYGENPPDIVKNRLEKELNSIFTNKFGVLYVIAKKLVENSEAQGYLVGSRGSVGASCVATMANITEVNPLPPHYRCPNCKHSEFISDGSVGSGFDLPEKNCPVCGTPYVRDGHDIPFEPFLGFKGDKSPDIDLNFSGDVQANAHKYTEVLFGSENVFRAGTIGTLAAKTAYGLYVMKYLEDNNIELRNAEIQHLVSMLVGSKRTTGQHPGGIIVVPREYEVYDFTPVQHPADDPKSDIITTHFAFEYLHDTILKLDILGHDVPTKYKILEKYTNTNILDTPLTDPQVLKLFTSCEPLGIQPSDIDVSGSPDPLKSGTFGLPEMGTKFVRQMLEDSQPKTFADLLQISGLSHGTNVWLGNAQDLIKNGICTISEVIGTRDSIMVYLMYKGLEPSMAFNIMEIVRKGNKPPKVLKEEHFKAMRDHNVPEWYIESCLKIKYMFPKAHAAAYVISALRLGYYKVYHPLEFYAAYFTAAPDGFDATLVMKGKAAVREWMADFEKRKDTTQRDNEVYSACQLILEAMCRGIKFLPVKLGKSDGKAFLPENGKIRVPFASLNGLGEAAAENIAEACRAHSITSILELKQYAKLTNGVIDILRNEGVLNGLDETNQITMFSMFNYNDDDQ